MFICTNIQVRLASLHKKRKGLVTLQLLMLSPRQMWLCVGDVESHSSWIAPVAME